MDNPLDGLMRKARAAYFLERRLFNFRVKGKDSGSPNHIIVKQWDGGTDSRGVNHQNVWLKIVKFALANNADACVLIKAVFNYWTGNEPPMPTVMYNEKTLDCLRNYKSHKVEELACALKASKLEAAQELMFKRHSRPDARDGDIWREVITSPTLTAGPLFRYCMACDIGQAELAARYRDSAMLEYVQSPNEYDKVLSKFLLDDFRRDARHLLLKLLNN